MTSHRDTETQSWIFNAARGVIAVATVIVALFAFAYAVLFAFGLGLPSPVFLENIAFVWPQIVLYVGTTPFGSMFVWGIAGVAFGLGVRPRSHLMLLLFATIYVVVLIHLLPLAVEVLGGRIRVEFP